MKITVNFTTSELVALTDNELGVLDRLLDAGDRGAFHYIYGTMSDVQDALLTAKISTFSDTVEIPVTATVLISVTTFVDFGHAMVLLFLPFD